MAFLDNTGLERLWTHILAKLGTKADASQVIMQATASSSDGVAYTATVDNITSLTTGVRFLMVPNKLSTSTTPTLNVNGLGAKGIRMKSTSGTGTGVAGYAAGWIAANRPIEVVYNGVFWIADICQDGRISVGTSDPASSGTPGSIYIKYTA